MDIATREYNRSRSSSGHAATTEENGNSLSFRSRMLDNTVSVDEYFDELVSLVHQDYADL